MFVIESIQPKSKQSKNSFELIYPPLSRLIGLGLLCITVLSVLVLIDNSFPSFLVIASIIFMCIIGAFYGLRGSKIFVDGTKKTITISKSFLFYHYFSTSLLFSNIVEISYENRWMGQTFQPKYRIFIHTEENVFDIGIVNQGMKINYILKKMWMLINPDKLKALDPEKE